MDELIIKARLLAKAEMILLRLHLRRAAKQTAFYVVAGLLAVLAVGMLNMALYLYLSTLLSAAGSALIVALADVLLAALVVLAAAQLDLGPEALEANTLRDLTMAELTSEIERVKAQIADLSDDIKKIRAAVTGVLSPGGFNLQSVLQWVPTVLGYFLRKRQ